jgi:hypothetical protein
MRTTLVLEDQLLLAAKQKAILRGITLSGVINDALRMAISQSPIAPRKAFLMSVFDGGEPRAHSPEEIAALRDEGR